MWCTYVFYDQNDQFRNYITQHAVGESLRCSLKRFLPRTETTVRNKVRTGVVLSAIIEETKKLHRRTSRSKLNFTATRVVRRYSKTLATSSYRLLHKCSREQVEFSAGAAEEFFILSGDVATDSKLFTLINRIHCKET